MGQDVRTGLFHRQIRRNGEMGEVLLVGGDPWMPEREETTVRVGGVDGIVGSRVVCAPDAVATLTTLGISSAKILGPTLIHMELAPGQRLNSCALSFREKN